MNKFLFSIFALCLIILILTENYFRVKTPRSDIDQMSSSVKLAKNWLTIIENIKTKNEQKVNNKFLGLLGNEYSEITTTLGSLEAKKISLNPYFAALTVKFLNDAGIDTTKTVGIILSGSFPGIAISVLAALHTLGISTLIMSSLGASSYGANDPEATWIDIENWLNIYGGLKYKSIFVTLGAEGDTGGGLSDTGIEMMKTAIKRTNRKLYIPNSLKESIDKHIQVLNDNNVDLLINIGGTHASLGDCIHNTMIPNGYIPKLKTCKDSLKGIIYRFAEQGKPIIHFLNIKDLALKYKIPFEYNPEVEIVQSLSYDEKYNIIPIIIAIGLVTILLCSLFYKNKFTYLSNL